MITMLIFFSPSLRSFIGTRADSPSARRRDRGPSRCTSTWRRRRTAGPVHSRLLVIRNTCGRDYGTRILSACLWSFVGARVFTMNLVRMEIYGTDLVWGFVLRWLSRSLDRREREKRVSPAYALRRRKKNNKALKTVSCVISKENYSYIIYLYCYV